MKTALFYDSETSSLPLFSKPSSDEGQPHLVQLAARLINLDTREDINSMNLFICPDGWEISPESTKIHGITQEYAYDYGTGEDSATNIFFDLAIMADVRIAHNESFDARIMRIAAMRYIDKDFADEWKAGNSECTMKLASPIVRAPATEKMKAAGRHGHKNCTMAEAYKHFTGKDMEGAHNAMVDVNACVDVYFAIKDMGKIV